VFAQFPYILKQDIFQSVLFVSEFVKLSETIWTFFSISIFLGASFLHQLDRMGTTALLNVDLLKAETTQHPTGQRNGSLQKRFSR